MSQLNPVNLPIFTVRFFSSIAHFEKLQDIDWLKKKSDETFWIIYCKWDLSLVGVDELLKCTRPI